MAEAQTPVAPPQLTTFAPALPDMALDFPSDASSPLSSMSRSPSPPTPYYLTPPPSQSSNTGSPHPESDESVCTSVEGDSRPPKRRRISSRMPRDTKHLDLQNLSFPPSDADQAEMDRLLKTLRKRRKIVVVAGAGISTSAGVPDFRSSNGLFRTLKARHNLKSSGKQLFDASVYKDDSSTATFHHMVRSLSHLTKAASPTPFHHLLARLAHEGRLLRLYSQNVDGIDTSLPPLRTEVPLSRKAPWPKTIQLHGGLEKMTCTKCHALSDFEPDLFDGPVPPACEKCLERDNFRSEVGKRSHGVGKLRPRMVLYNEHNPDDEAIGAVTRADLKTRPDAIIVVGTTLKVPGVKRIVKEMCRVVKDHRDGLAVWINHDTEPTLFENCWDLVVRGTCDQVAHLANLGRWDAPDDAQAQDFQEISQEQVEASKKRSGTPAIVINPAVKALKDYDNQGLPTPAQTPTQSPAPSPSKVLGKSQFAMHFTPRRATLHKDCESFASLLKSGIPQSDQSAFTGKPTVGNKGRKASVKGKLTATSGKKAVKVKRTTATGQNAKINSAFTVTKAATTKATGVPKGKTSRAGTPSTPKKGKSGSRSPTKYTRPMVPVSPVAAKVNQTLPSIRSIFPNLGRQTNSG